MSDPSTLKLEKRKGLLENGLPSLKAYLQERAIAYNAGMTVYQEAEAEFEKRSRNLEHVKRMALSFNADNVRRHKTYHQVKLCQIGCLEAGLNKHQDELEKIVHNISSTIEEKTEEIRIREKQLAEVNQRMTDLATDFKTELTNSLQTFRVNMNLCLDKDSNGLEQIYSGLKEKFRDLCLNEKILE